MDDNLKRILLREGDKYRPSLENRVAYQQERDISILTSWMDRDRNKNIYRVVENEIIRLKKEGAGDIGVLDAGCAYGNHIFMLNARAGKDSGIHFVGMDVNPKTILYPHSFKQEIEGYDNCDFLLCSLDDGICFKDNSFDVALCSDVLEHCANPGAALKELSRILKRGGKVILTSPLRRSLFKTASSFLNKISFGSLERRYLEGGTKDSPDIKKEDKPEFGLGHVSEMNLKEYIAAGRDAGLQPVEIIPTSVFSGSMFFDNHPFLLAGLIFIEAFHRVFKFVSWAHGIQIVFEKK
jgi:ubiquinone/menaquinone biosynthesis C-methylase UbiE